MKNEYMGNFHVEMHPELFIGETKAAELTDNTANSEYSQDTGAWD